MGYTKHSVDVTVINLMRQDRGKSKHEAGSPQNCTSLLRHSYIFLPLGSMKLLCFYVIVLLFSLSQFKLLSVAHS